jgi:hypothetical protein
VAPLIIKDDFLLVFRDKQIVGPVKFLKVPLGCMNAMNFYGMLESLEVLEEI